MLNVFLLSNIPNVIINTLKTILEWIPRHNGDGRYGWFAQKALDDVVAEETATADDEAGAELWFFLWNFIFGLSLRWFCHCIC